MISMQTFRILAEKFGNIDACDDDAVEVFYQREVYNLSESKKKSLLLELMEQAGTESSVTNPDRLSRNVPLPKSKDYLCADELSEIDQFVNSTNEQEKAFKVRIKRHPQTHSPIRRSLSSSKTKTKQEDEILEHIARTLDVSIS